MSLCLSKSLARMAAVSYRLVAISRSYSSSSSSSASLASQAVSISHRPDNSLAYFIPRNTRGSLPVYTDIRNGGTRYLVLVRNIRGNIHSLRDDLASSLFPANSEQAARLKAEIARPDTLVVTGGRWKHDVMDWLRRQGF
ncbi:hypothetical protein ACEPAH_4936 [Sanghuangporus vaninii]